MYTASRGIEELEGRRYFSIIQTGPQPNPKPIIDNATDINGGLIFSLSQNTLGSQSQFWFGDGTQKGTHLFHTTDTPPFFTAAGGQAFFGDLERTDGTAKGTKLVKQLESEISDPVFAGGLLYFLLPTAAGANSPFALWRSDGTAAGTIPLGITLTAGGTGFDLRGPPVLQAVGNKLYFLDNRRSGTHFLGVSDGTVAGTHFIKNLPQNSYASFQQPNYQILSSGNEAIVFANTQGFNGAVPSVAIWRSDGKAADTQLVFKSSFTGGGNFFNDVAVAGPDLYIDVNGGMVRINPMKGPATTIVPFAFLPSYPASVAIGDTLYFVHPSPTTGSDTAALFAIDSTSTSPRLVKDYAQAGSQNVVPAGSQNTITGLFNSGGQLYVSHRQTLTNNDEIDTYTAMNPNGTGKDVMAIDESAPPNGIPGFISAPMPLVLPEKQELVVFSSGIHLLAPTGQIDYWNPATPKGKLALTNHIAGGQSDIQFKLVFVDSFMSGLTIKPLKLIGPNGDVLEAKLLNVSGAGTSSSPKVARFHVIGPGGSWGANDVGKYRVIVPKDAITTDTGAFAPGTVGTLSLVQADGETTSIQGIVYQDDNADGVQDNGEKGFVGATVFLDTNGDGELDGEESFTQSYDDKFSFVDHVDLAGGDYRVAVVPEPGMIFTTPDSFLLSCEPGTVAYASFGMRIGGELRGKITNFTSGSADRVYDDSNQNGKFDSGELFAFIENDSYDFYGLSEGLHHIRVHYKSGAITIPPQQDVIIRPGKQAHANFNLTVAITVTGHCSFAGKGVAGLTIFAEADNNGTLNIGEPSTVTDANGNYTLTAPLNDKLMVAPNKGLRPTSTSPIFIYGEQPVINIPLTAAPSLQLLGFYDDNGNGRRDDGERLSTGDVTILCNLSGGDYFKKQMSYFEPPTAGVYTMSHIAESSGGISTNRIPTTPLPITITLKRGEAAVMYFGV